MEGITRGLHGRHKGRNRFRVGGVRGTNVNARTDGRTDGQGKNNFVKYSNAVGKRSGNFLKRTCTQATIRYGETSSLRDDVWLLITSREVNMTKWPHTCSRPCAFEEKKCRKKKTRKKTPHPKHDRDHLETVCNETRPTRSPTLARFHRSRVCRNRPRTALAISKNDECYTHRQTS